MSAYGLYANPFGLYTGLGFFNLIFLGISLLSKIVRVRIRINIFMNFNFICNIIFFESSHLMRPRTVNKFSF